MVRQNDFSSMIPTLDANLGAQGKPMSLLSNGIGQQKTPALHFCSPHFGLTVLGVHRQGRRTPGHGEGLFPCLRGRNTKDQAFPHLPHTIILLSSTAIIYIPNLMSSERPSPSIRPSGVLFI